MRWMPPSRFEVSSSPGFIDLQWETRGTTPHQWEIYRTSKQYWGQYEHLATVDGSTTSYEDAETERGVPYFYYIQAVSASTPDGTAETPTATPLKSSRYYTQTYAPARLKRPQGEALAEIRVVPNPLHVGSDQQFRFGGGGTVDRLAFSELGERIATIIHDDGSGDEFWDLTTESRQVVASGLYIAVFTVTEDIPDPDNPGQLLYERGQRAFRKFVVIR